VIGVCGDLPPPEYHLTPTDDLRDHELSPECWCHPTEDEEDPRCWIHNAMDGREAFETGERKPS